MQWTAGPWESMISSWGSWRGPGGWIPPGLPLCPLGTSLSSWLDFRGAPLSRWTQSSWSSCLLRQRWRTAPLWQTSAELRAGRHRTPSQDSTISALSQFLPVCWVSNGREELASVTLATPFPLTRGYERLFLPQFSSPDGEPWWNPPSIPSSQTGRSSLTPGPVLVLARPGLRSAPVLG